MIDIYVKELDSTWFGVAYIKEEIVATAISSTKESALRSLSGSISVDCERQITEKGSDFAEKTILMLKELDAGNEESKSFSLANSYLPEPAAKVLKTAPLFQSDT